VSGAVGRAQQQSRLRELLTAAAAGSGGGAVIVAAPGHGGSTLLADLVADAREQLPEMRIVVAAAVDAERHVAWAGLSQIVVSLRDRLAGIDEHPARVLRTALGWQEGEPATAAAVAMALLALVVDSADSAPTLITIDDAHLLDAASLGALGFVARRLRDAPALVVVVARPDSDAAGALGESIVLGPLDRDASRLLLAALGVRDGVTVEQLVDACAGHPAALTEMGRSLTPEQRAGRQPLPSPIPVGSVFAAEVAARLRSVPDITRRSLLVLAAASLEGGSVEDPSTLDPGLAAGIVQRVGDRVEFADEAVRSAVYWGADPAARRQVHRSIAARMADGDPHRLWHLAAAAVAPDGALAAAIGSLAEGQLHAGGAASAADNFVRAAELEPETAARATWQRRAVEAALAAGRVPLAVSLLEALPATEGAGSLPEPAAGALLRARVEVLTGQHLVARDRYRALARDELVDPVQRAEAAVGATGLSLRMYDLADALTATFHDCADPEVQRRSEILRGAIEQYTGGSGAGFQRYRELLVEGTSNADLEFLSEVVGRLLGITGQIDSTLEVLEHVHRESARRGWMQPLPDLLLGRALLLARWDLKAAAAAAEQSLQLSDEMGTSATSIFAVGVLSNAAAGLGEERALELAERLLATGTDAGRIGAHKARGYLHMTYERYTDVVDACIPLHEWADGQMRSGLLWQADLAEAAWRTGDRVLAEDVAKQLHTFVLETPTAWLRGASERISGLFATDAEFDAHYARSVEHFDSEGLSIGAARSLLLWGERLRRVRRRSDARVRLTAARERFAAAGMDVWARRCDRELVASGVRANETGRRGASEVLTPQELQVARWIVAGESYRQVASRLFISPRTVEGHLAAVYRKLGVAGRMGLAARAHDDPSLLRSG
jgi:DNA-binding CsgD family transcriptional regulator